ncbi:receptor-type tyrosine-protein phosphatase H-like isoform X2 [Acanthaster planci]|uniref:Receptor-type tyrosine-protein phosphatase H-like isoform X2 n=1 Tax=Acanthaster planci TaxID=133434 RepID=A0A8B7XEK9_ACAPL|nr:receptor-type tyrosine-protein phosphatase H-like isoform X2 [Acanthaster planci]
MLSIVMLIIAANRVSAAVCPDNIHQSTDPGQPTAVVSWTTETNHTCSPESGSSFSTGNTLAECIDEDDGSRCAFTVNVTDDESPKLTCGTSVTANTDYGKSTGQATWNNPQGSDNVGVNPIRCDATSGSTFPLGTSRVTCRVQDTSGNEAMCTIQVTIQDNEDPVFSKCPNKPIRQTIPDFDPLRPPAAIQVTWDLPSANDNSGRGVTLTSTHEPGEEFELGVTSVTYTARDESGNENNDCTFFVQVVVQPPVDIFAENVITGNTDSCMTVVWPESKDGAIEEYALYHWTQGMSKPDPSQRIVITPQQGSITYTYNRYTICNLSPGELYTVEMEEESGGKISSMNQWSRPSAPNHISVVPGTLSSTSVELTWERVSLQNLEQYRVSLYIGYTSTLDLGYMSKTTDRLMVDSLRPGTSIVASVYAVVGSRDERLESQRRSLAVTIASLSDREFLAYNFTESTIAVAWHRQVNTYNGKDPYMLYIEPEDADENYLTVFSPGDPAWAEFVGLKPNTEYKIRLISNLGLSLSASQKTRPGRVANLRPTLVRDDAITLEWDAPAEGVVDSYEVHISPGEDNDPTTVSSTSCHFSSLRAKTEYFFKVVSVYDNAKSVPQTLHVTAGVTKAEASNLVNIPAIVFSAVLGLLSIVLTIGLVILYLKYRRLKKGKGETTSVAGSSRVKKKISNATIQDQDTRRYQMTTEDSDDVYENASPSTLPNPLAPTAPAYQNAVMGHELKPLPKSRNKVALPVPSSRK